MTVTEPAPHSTDLIIVSASDSGYFSLLRDAVASLRALHRTVAIGVLDLGLTEEERTWLRAQGAQVLRPGWDVEFPGQERQSEILKGLVARPFLPRHFPGYAMYVWLDADAWVQDWRAIELYCSAAGRNRVAITLELDRAYKRHYKRPKPFGMNLAWKTYRQAFGWRVADRLGRNPTANCGVYALHRDAPHWQVWGRIVAGLLRRQRFFFVDQIAMNYAIFGEKLPANFLPAYCNWAVGDALPAFDYQRGLFVEPYAPHEVIGVMHLAGRDQKTGRFELARLDGGTVETSLRYGESRGLCERRFAEFRAAAAYTKPAAGT